MRNEVLAAAVLLGVALLTTACQREPPPAQPRHEPSEPLVLMSSVFEPGALIPEAYTCTGSDARPPLAWSTPPEGTRSLALTLAKLDDTPPALVAHLKGTVLWTVFNLPPSLQALPEDLSLEEDLQHHEPQPMHGINYFGTVGYDGPCPPWGDPGRYAFRIYALNITLDLDAGATSLDLFKAMTGHILAEGELVGAYAYPND